MPRRRDKLAVVRDQVDLGILEANIAWRMAREGRCSSVRRHYRAAERRFLNAAEISSDAGFPAAMEEPIGQLISRMRRARQTFAKGC